MKQTVIGNFISQKRKEKNLTQEQLAEKLGISNKTVSKWETGKSMPDYSIIELLCEVLSVSISELITGKEKDADINSSSLEEKLALLSYKVEQLENQKDSQLDSRKTVTTGISLGSVLAVVISYTKWQSIGWAIFHGLMSWGYVIYYLIKY